MKHWMILQRVNETMDETFESLHSPEKNLLTVIDYESSTANRNDKFIDFTNLILGYPGYPYVIRLMKTTF